MSVSVNFNGVAYSIPEDGETGWSALTDYLVALSNAAVGTILKSNVRTVITSPATIQSLDTVLLMALGSGVINLPAGVKGQFYAIYDKIGQAKNSPLTINAAGGDTIKDGVSTSYTIKTNYGGVLLQYADSGNLWQIIAEIKDIYPEPFRVSTDATNASFVRAAVTPESTAFVSVGNNQTCSVEFTGSKAIHFVIAVDNDQIYCVTDYHSNVITALSDQKNHFRETDSGGGVYVSKATNSGVVAFKNNHGNNRVYEIRALTNQLNLVTAWS
jgi:hypothetical protein